MGKKKLSSEEKRALKRTKQEKQKRRENIAVFTTLGICIALLLVLVAIIVIRNIDFKDDTDDTGNGPTVTAGETLTYNDFTYYKSNDEGIGIMSYTGSAEKVTIPSEIDGVEVKYVWDAFRNNETVKEVVIPNTVIELDGCFEGCKNLTKVTFYNSVSIIYENTFKDCEKLSSVEFYGSKQQYELIQLYDGTASNAKLLSATVTYMPYN